MIDLKKYLDNSFGIKIKFLPLENEEKNRLPVYMRKYNLETVIIYNYKFTIMKVDGNNDYTTDIFKKQGDLIEKLLGLPVIYVLENLEAYKRKRLIEKKVAFVIPGKQLYIPKLLLELRENKNQQEKKTEIFSPAAQCLLLYYLLGNQVEGLNFKTLAKKLNYGQMTITRAVDTLKKHGFVSIEGSKNKTLVIKKDKKQLWKEALPFLSSPIEKEIYKEELSPEKYLYITGINALAGYTTIAGEYKKTFAVYKEKFKDYARKENNNIIYEPTEGNIIIQVWKYDPGILTNNQVVDPLSLYLCLNQIDDERIEKELNNLVEKLW